MKHLLILLLICNSTLAENAIILKPGDIVPWEGILISKTTAEEFRQTTIERDSLKEVNTSLNKSLSLETDINVRNDNKIKLLLDQNDSLAKSLQSSQSLSTIEKVGYIVLGIASVAIGTYILLEGIKTRLHIENIIYSSYIDFPLSILSGRVEGFHLSWIPNLYYCLLVSMLWIFLSMFVSFLVIRKLEFK